MLLKIFTKDLDVGQEI